MSGLILNTYTHIKKIFNNLSRAYALKKEELKPAFEVFDNRENLYLKSIIALEKKKEVDVFVYEDALINVKKRFYSNFWRIISGKDLIQDEEDSLGIRYCYVGSSNYKKKRFFVKDSDKYDTALKSLESKLEEKDLTNFSSDYTGANNKIFAKYISDFSNDCFTNSLARISSKYSGSVGGVADILAGYVSSGESSVAPHTRSWKSRVSELERVIFSSGFSDEDKSRLSEVKDALSKNKYLIKNRKEEYVRAVNLINCAIRKNKEAC